MPRNSIALAWWWFLMLVLSVAAAGLLVISDGHAHDLVITTCSKNLQVKEVFFIEKLLLENGMVSETYSKYPGGPIFIEALSIKTARYEGEDHEPFPLFYIVDVDGDGTSDHTYEDVAWDEPTLMKHCENILEVDSRAWLDRKEM